MRSPPRDTEITPEVVTAVSQLPARLALLSLPASASAAMAAITDEQSGDVVPAGADANLPEPCYPDPDNNDNVHVSGSGLNPYLLLLNKRKHESKTKITPRRMTLEEVGEVEYATRLEYGRMGQDGKSALACLHWVSVKKRKERKAAARAGEVAAKTPESAAIVPYAEGMFERGLRGSPIRPQHFCKALLM